MLKNGKIDPRIYADMISNNTIGFEGLHFYLFRMQHAFIFIDILWKIMLTHEKEYAVFKYIFEVVINQLFEEYIFIKTVFKGLEDKFHYKEDEVWIIDLLYFYEHFTWKNKRFVEMYDKYNWYFKSNLIRFPSIFFMDETGMKLLNEKLLEYRDQVDKRKHYITNKRTYKQLSELTATYFKQIAANLDDGENDWLLFSRKSILNKLEVDIIQKRFNHEDKQYISEIQYDNFDPKYADEEKDTRNSLSDKL